MVPLPLSPTLRLALPKGRIQAGIFELFRDAGISITEGARAYRPRIGFEGTEAKLLKPQGIVQMLLQGSRDVGFTGADWVRELGAELVPLLDTRLDPVRLVLASPKDASWPPVRGRMRCATEYVGITRAFAVERKLDLEIIRSQGATEVYPPEDADCIVDNTATGATLEANGLVIREEIFQSSTQLYATREALDDPWKNERIGDLVTMLESVLAARRRVMLELNAGMECLEAVVAILPAMREPTISRLHADAGFAVRAAVPREQLPVLIPKLKRAGGTDIVISEFSQIVS